MDLGALLEWLQLDGQDEVVTRQVFDFEKSGRHDAPEAAFVRVVLAVGPVHGQQPGTAGSEVELVNGVAETVRSPPAGDPKRIAHRGEDLRRGCRYEQAS